MLRELADAGMTRSDHVVALGGGRRRRPRRLLRRDLPARRRGRPGPDHPGRAGRLRATAARPGSTCPQAKNYVGAYHQPAAVIADTADAADAARGGAGGRLGRGAEDGAARRRPALGGGVGAQGGRERAELGRDRLRLRPLQGEVVAADERDAGLRADRSTSATRSATRSRRRPAMSATATARRSASACWRRCGSPTPTAARRGGGMLLEASACRTRLDGTSTSRRSLDAVERDKKRDRRGRRGSCCSPSPASRAPGQLVDPARVREAVEELSLVTRRATGSRCMHGVNFDVLERRDPEIYGGLSLTELEIRIKHWARELELEARFFQTNSRGRVRRAPAPAARAGRRGDRQRRRLDPLQPRDRRRARARRLPAVEVHLSDVDSREDWRGISVFDGIVIGEDLRQGAGRLPRGARGARPGARRRRTECEAGATGWRSWSPSESSIGCSSPTSSTSAT